MGAGQEVFRYPPPAAPIRPRNAVSTRAPGLRRIPEYLLPGGYLENTMSAQSLLTALMSVMSGLRRG
jgi:hypothetical protein